MSGLIKKIFIWFLTGIISVPDDTKCISLSNQKCLTQPTLINLHPNDYSQEFHSNPFVVKLDRYVGDCNGLSDKVFVPNKTEGLNLTMFNMITGINES